MSEIKKFGRFEVQRVLGRGGMGTVHLAVDPLIGRTVAIKEIRIDQIDDERERIELEERFKLEFKSAGKLSHPNIVTIYDVGQSDDVYFIAMEYVDGMSLAERLKKEPRPPFDVITDLAAQIASGLDFAHEHGIVHRDIKPANVLLTPDGRPMITDFGLVKVLASELTMTGTVLGTPAFMSPEQVTGRAAVDRKSDQFSFAVILYLMLTGTQPFPAEHPSAILYKIVHEEPERPKQINRLLPAAVDRTILRGLAKDPEHRYPDCSTLSAELASAIAGKPIPERRVPAAADAPAAGSGPAAPSASGERSATLAPDDFTLAGTTPTPRHRRRSRGGRWLGAAALIVAMAAFSYWASQRLRDMGNAEPPIARTDTAPPSAESPAAESPAEGSPAAASPPPVAAPEPPEPTAPEAPAPLPSTLEITSQPAGAAVRVDGRDVGLVTPAEWEFAAGRRHALALHLEGYEPAGWSFDLDELSAVQRECACLHFPLVSSAPPGYLVIRAQYPVALLIDGRTEGPFTEAEVPVAPGRRHIELVAEQVFLRQTRTVEVGSDQRRQLRVPNAVSVRITAFPANCRVSIDGLDVDVTPINNRRIAVGSHRFEFYWPALSKTKQMRVTVSRNRQRIHATPD